MYNVYVIVKTLKNNDINNILLIEKYRLIENKNIYYNYIINKIKSIFYN